MPTKCVTKHKSQGQTPVSGTKGNVLFLTLTPIAAIAITYFSVPFLTKLESGMLEQLPYVPYLVILSVIALGGFFGKHRVTFISVILGLAYLITHNVVSAPGLANANLLLNLVSILLPLNIAVVSGLKELQLFSIKSLILISAVFSQVLVCSWVTQNYPQEIGNIVLFTPEAISSLLPQSISLATLIAFLLGFILLIRLIIKNGTVFEYSFTGAFISVFFFFQAGIQTPADAIFMVTASLIMAWGLLHNSYLIAYIDELTELPGRRAMTEEMSHLRGLYAIAMLDIDHFKKFNDTYGHDVGDQVLRMVAGKIGKIGGNGKAFRYGGEEFAIIFPGKGSKAAFSYLSNLRETIDHSSLILRNQDRPSKKPDKMPPKKIPWQEVHVTISIGIADSSEDLINTDEIMKAADDALYRSKEKGRNRISQYSTKDYSPEFEAVDEEV